MEFGTVVMINHSNAVFEMRGGAIRGNSTAGPRGVHLLAGTFNMSGGTISSFKTTSADAGGGVFLTAGAVFNMSGTAKISDNQAYNGGGVYQDGSSVVTMSGSAEISNNTASHNGGGVYRLGATPSFTMSGTAKISNNQAVNGGGVYGGGMFTMSGAGTGSATVNAKISDNTASEDGGGVYVTNTFTMKDGIISGNTAQQGGGVAVYTTGTFTMESANGGTYISNNTVSLSGGGVYVLGRFNLNGGEIGGNVVNRLSTTPDKGTRARGAGVFVSRLSSSYPGRFVQGGGSIFGNGDGAAKANVVKINGVDVLSMPASEPRRGHGSLVCIHIDGTDPSTQTTWHYTQKETDGGMTLDTNNAEDFVNAPWKWKVPGYDL
jgi:hypothetical protein